MSKSIYAVCLDEELNNNPDYWVIARDYDSESEALAAKTLTTREEYRVTQDRYSGEKLKPETYAVGSQMLKGGVFKLINKEDGQ
jgi:hypothetical protein